LGRYAPLACSGMWLRIAHSLRILGQYTAAKRPASIPGAK